MTEEPDPHELSRFMREVYRLLPEDVERVLTLDGLLTLCALTMGDLEVVGQQVSFPPARLGAEGEPLWSFDDVERWLGSLY